MRYKNCGGDFIFKCDICPRNCQADRRVSFGYCGGTDQIKVARAALHFWEEPCLSGTSGSGTVFFSGCSMHCVFCQNHEIANGQAGQEISVERLAEIFLELQEQNANNINLVTAGHFTPAVVRALLLAREQGLAIPVVYNSSGYESVETLKMLEGLVDVYLPDFKYWEAETAGRYSNAPDYPQVAKAAIAEMVRQVGKPVFAGKKEWLAENAKKNGIGQEAAQEECLLVKGVLVRHLILPGHTKESKAIIKYLLETYGDQIYISIMNQYTPMPGIAERGFPELNRKVTRREYEKVIDYAIELGLENGFIQEGETAKESFIPAFDGFGV